MTDLYLKLIEIFISRKDKFIRADENFKRRETFFKEIKEIEARNDLDSDQKRVLKDSSAQKLTGNSLVTFQFLEYFFRNDQFRNFEVSATTAALWGGFISYKYLEDGYITEMWINKYRFLLQLFYLVLVGALVIFALIFLTYNISGVINFMASSFHINVGLVGAFFCGFIFLLISFFMFIVYAFISFFEVVSILS